MRSENILLNELDFYLVKKKKKTGNSEIHSVRLENFLNRSPTVNKTSAESFMKFGCDLRNFY